MSNISIYSKLTKQQQDFAHAVVEYGNSVTAYKEAYNTSELDDKAIKKLALRELRRPIVSNRINNLRNINGLALEITQEVVAETLFHAMHEAREAGKLNQMTKAAMDLAKLKGFIVDKADVNSTHAFQQMSEVTIGGAPMPFNIGKAVDTPPVIDVTPVPDNNEDLV